MLAGSVGNCRVAAVLLLTASLYSPMLVPFAVTYVMPAIACSPLRPVIVSVLFTGAKASALVAERSMGEITAPAAKFWFRRITRLVRADVTDEPLIVSAVLLATRLARGG